MALPWTCKKQDAPKKTKSNVTVYANWEDGEIRTLTNAKMLYNISNSERDKRHDNWWMKRHTGKKTLSLI